MLYYLNTGWEKYINILSLNRNFLPRTNKIRMKLDFMALDQIWNQVLKSLSQLPRNCHWKTYILALLLLEFSSQVAKGLKHKFEIFLIQ